MGDKVGENPAALRAAVFLLSAKNRRGGVQTPPSRAKVNIRGAFKNFAAWLLRRWWRCFGMLTDVLLVNFLEQGCAINGEYYTYTWNSCEQQSSRRDVANSQSELLLRDNAPTHKVAMDKAANCGFELLPHPLYSPDLATSDYHLFPNMKKQLGDRVFADNEETMTSVLNVLNGF